MILGPRCGRRHPCRLVLSSVVALALTTIAAAQNPDVQLKFDGRLDYRIPNGGSSTQRLYDTLGRPSLLKLSFTLEPGLRAFVSQRLKRIAHDGDPDLLDEFYVENQGVWRLGKQLMPFGNGSFLRETVLGARGDIDLPIEGASLAIAIADAGPDRQRGIVGRLSFFDGDAGISAAIGEHWGIEAGSFTLFRKPEDSPGEGAGLRRIYGLDAAHSFGELKLKGEFVVMQEGRTRRDPTGEAFDFTASIHPSKNRTYTVGWTRSPGFGDFYRIVGELETIKNVFIEPMVRFRNGVGYDFSVQLHLRL